MAKLPLAAAALFLSIFVGVPASGQPAAPDLSARLKDVEGNTRQLEAAVKAGGKIASFCANCHGDGGNSIKPDVPNLAGQNAHYLLEAMRQYMDGRRKNSEFKQRLIKVLSADEKVNLIAFFAAQSVAYKPPADATLAAKGKAIYLQNCSECHEEDGRGTQKYARLAGQQPVYLMHSLKGYRDGTGSRVNRQMAVSIEGMTDPDMTALVAYISSMK
jgi:cytochrome c553